MRQYRTLKPPPPGTPSLVRQFFALAHAERMGIQDIADRAGYNAETIKHWKLPSSRRLPLVTTLQDCLQVLGYDLVIRRVGTSHKERFEEQQERDLSNA